MAEFDAKLEVNEAFKSFGTALFINFDCLNRDQTLILLQRINTWASQRKAETKSPWKDIVIQITWALTGNARLWCEKLNMTEQ